MTLYNVVCTTEHGLIEILKTGKELEGKLPILLMWREGLMGDVVEYLDGHRGAYDAYDETFG